ncbi:MAG: acetyl/propionyl/methylcrotonyl-CoA carboxylase subunit alpha [Pseudomonadota bacterium]
MFDKILIANRGEIARRVIRSARKMGVSTVAIHSDADENAPHVREADEAVGIGPPPAAQSYLVVDKILDAIKQTGAQAVHPGYGFLSENEGFAKALDAAGVAFIGPPPGAIAAMGDKIESKRLAKAAGVSVVPGHPDAVADLDEAVRISEEVGYPVMLKASAGGGGKGMRIARNADEVREGLQSARNEAKNSFGDDRVFIEKFVEKPRHIEIQVLADGHGNCVYLGERECSVQRRHQKVLEEAPSPFLDDATRKAMGEQSVALAKAVDYRSAGTVEFIVDAQKNFYFLEMNTRLQVEHPVTEEVTGLDLVELMIRVAAGEQLPFGQNDVRLDGWAMEARLYAEDPRRNFAPSIGRISTYREPSGEGVRVDSGVVEGSEVSTFYDPMIAKLIAAGPDRATAIDRLRAALDGYVVRGVGHNAAFLSCALDRPAFRGGDLDTGFIEREFPDGFDGAEADPVRRERVAAAAALAMTLESLRDITIDGQLEGRVVEPQSEWIVRVDGEEVPVIIDLDDLDETEGLRIAVGADLVTRAATDWRPGEALMWLVLDGDTHAIQLRRTSLGFFAQHDGAELDAQVLTPRAAGLMRLMPEKAPPDLSKFLLSPMPGLLVSIAVSEGEKVDAGQQLAVVEAMKMENVLRAGASGTVKAVMAEAGANLAVDQKIIEFE